MEKLGDDSAAKFINALIKSVQTLCHGYLDFQNGVEIIGHINLSVDKGNSLDYILKEKVCKNAENSTLFISNSFHAEPKPDQEVSGRTSQSATQPHQNSESPDPAESGKVSSAISSISSALTESRERSRRNSGAKDSSSSHSHPNTAKRKASEDESSEFRPAKISYHDRLSHVTSESSHPARSSSPVDSKEALQALRTVDTDLSETVLPQTASVRSDCSDIGVNLAGSVLEPVEGQNNPDLHEREDDSDGDLEVTFIKEEYVEGEGSACDFDGQQQFMRGPHQRASDGMPDPSMFSLGPQSSSASATYVPSAAGQQFPAGASTSSTSQPQPGPSGVRVHASFKQSLKPLPAGVTPECGYVHPDDASKWEMYELHPGSGVFIHREDFDSVMSKRRDGKLDGKAMARYLMNCFWKHADFVGATLAEPPRSNQRPLDRGIINAILNFCCHMSEVKRPMLRNIMSSKVTKANSLYRQQLGMPPRKAGRPVRNYYTVS